MTNSPAACPECGSDAIAFIEKTGQCFCTNNQCSHRWTVDDSDQPTIEEPVQQKVTLFLSYGRKDAKNLADRLSVDLAAAGYEVWRDTREIRAGRSWEDQIEDGLRSTQIMIALLSPHAVRKSNDPDNADNLDGVCLDEISFARFARPPMIIIPAMVSQCDPPFCIFRLDYVDLTSWSQSEEQYRSGFQELLEGIEAARRNEVRYRSWMHRLKPLDVFDAYLNEKRQDFCGREWLLDEIDAWRFSRRERALLITGDPGTGKSAIVAQLVHLNPDAQLLAYHCCIANTPETLRPGRFVQSLAAMIGSRLPDYADMLETAELQEALSDACCHEDPASAFESGILARLESLPAPEEGVRYILIDALDEALTLRGSGPTIVDLLARRLDRLPGWLRIVATTRKEPEVLRKLSMLRAETIDANDPRNLEDIDTYIAGRLQTPNLVERLVAAQVSLEEVQRQLREAGNGNFLYVKQALIDIERDNYRLDRLEKLPQGLTGLYQAFFGRHFGEKPAAETYGPTRRVLEVVVAAYQPLEASQLARATGLDRDYELSDVLRQLASFLPERDGRHTLYHKSLVDWLTQPDNPYRASRRRGHEQLAEMCRVEYESHVESMSRYVLAYIPEHLIGAERWDDLETVLTDLRYIQAACTAGMTFDLVRDFNDALAALPELQQERQQQEQRQERLRQYGRDLIAYAQAKDEGVPLPVPPDTRDAQESMRRAEAGSRVSGSSNVDPLQSARVRAFANFVSSHSHQLGSFPDQTFPIGFNHASGGLVVAQAGTILDSRKTSWLRRDPCPPTPPDNPACLRTLAGHTGPVTAVALTSDRNMAVSGCEDETLRVWDVDSGECLRTFQGHTSSVRAVALTPDGHTAVSASDDQTLRVWDVDSGECLRTLQGHTSSVRAVALTPDGHTAVSAGDDQTLRVWDVDSGECLRTLQGHTSWVTAVALTPDGHTAVSASDDQTLHVWGVDSGECLRTLQGHTSSVRAVALTPDGHTAVSASDDQTLRVWDVDSGECLRTLQGHTSWVTAVALTPDGHTAVSASADKTLRVWDVDSGECLRTLQGHTSWVTAVAATPDGHTAVTGSRDETLRVWDVDSGECLRTLQGHTGRVTAVALTPDGHTAVSAGADKTLRVWDVDSGECLRTFQGHSSSVRAVALTPDGHTAVSAGDDQTLRVWDVDSGECLRTLQGHTDRVRAVALTPDGHTAVSASDDQTLRVWDVDSGECLRTLQGHTSSVRAVALTPDGHTAVSAGDDQTLRVWDVDSGECLRTLQGHTDRVTAVALTPDGHTAVSASRDRTLRMWDVATGALVAIYSMEAIGSSVAVALDNRIIAGTSSGQLHFITLCDLTR